MCLSKRSELQVLPPCNDGSSGNYRKAEFVTRTRLEAADLLSAVGVEPKKARELIERAESGISTGLWTIAVLGASIQ